MENNSVIRSMIADFLYCEDNGVKRFCLMGMGYTSLDENPNAQAESRAYISHKSASSTIRGYETQFPFATDIFTSEPAIRKILDVGRNQRRGSAAEADYVRVETFLPTGLTDVHPARKFRASIEVTDIAGEGAQIVECTGNLNQVGDFTPGVFDIVSRTFHPGTTDQDDVLTVSVNGTIVKLRNGLYVEGGASQGLGLFSSVAGAMKDDD